MLSRVLFVIGLLLLSSTLLHADLSVGNDYINIILDDSTGTYTIGANPDGAGWRPLMFGYPLVPSTSWIKFKVDRNTEAQPGMPDSVISDPLYLAAIWNDIHGVGVLLQLSPISLGAPGEFEFADIRIEAWSTDGMSHTFGCLIEEDVLGAIGTSFGYVGHSEIFTAPALPAQWRTYAPGPPPDSAEFTATGVLTGFGTTTPDVFWYGPWTMATAAGWDHTTWPVGSALGDGAMLIKWSLRIVSPGDSLSLTTYYGIAPTGTTALEITHSAPTVYRGCCGTLTPNPMTLNFILTNSGTEPITGLYAWLWMIDSGCVIASGLNPHSWASLPGHGGTQTATWTVQFTSPDIASCQYRLLTNWGGDSAIRDFLIDIPPRVPCLEVSAIVDTVTICAGANMFLAVEATGGQPPYTYAWSPTTAISDPNVQIASASPTVTTTYTCGVRDARGCYNEASATAVVVSCGDSAFTYVAGNPFIGWLLLSVPGGFFGDGLMINPPSALALGEIFRYSPAGYYTADSGWIPAGEGFWALFSLPCTLSTMYHASQRDSIIVDIAGPGWYILGNTLAGATVESLLTDPPGSLVSSQVHIYVPGVGYMTLTSGGIPPGRGYWALFGNACRLRIR